ncbi:MAG: hypothetical protein HQ517_08530 [SAR324 cluster bacterium]|nr:hypothetical protein [SAR324 cluster bacterium]
MRKNAFQTNVQFQLKHFALLLLLSISMVQITNAQTAPHIVYASQAGAHLDSDVSTGGGTDDTQLIQEILDRAPKIGSLKLVVDGAILVKGLKVHSNTTIECLSSNCGFFLADHSDQPIVSNADPSLTERRNRNIAFLGGTYNGNGAKQAHDVPGRGWTTGFALFGVEQVTFRDVTIRNTATFAVMMTNWERAVFENIDIDNHTKLIHQDGIHLCGPGRFLSMRNIRGVTGDDFIALNADDGHADWNQAGEFVRNNILGPHASFGPITDVDIDGVFIDGANNGIRILSRKSRVDRISIRNVQGSFRKYGFFLQPHWRQGGDCGRITFENIDMRPVEPDYGPLPFVFFLAGHFEHLTLRNIQSHLPVDSRPVIWVMPHAKIDVLSVEGMQIYQKDPRSAKTPVIQVDGQVDLLEVRNVTLYRGKEMPIDGALIRTDPDKTKLKNYLRIGTSQTKPNPTNYGKVPLDSRGWPEAQASLEIIPKINRLHLSNITVNRIASVVQHDNGEIGYLQLDNIMTSDVPNTISVGGDAKIGAISPASARKE